MCTNLKSDVEAKLGASYTVFEPKTFTAQVVAGINYKVKIKVDGESYVHVKIYKPLPHT